jgi:DNA polymerase III epsilon subunit family exonuclease
VSIKVKPSELMLGDKLSDGAVVVGRKGNGAIVLARPALESGWEREERFVFSWPSGDEKEIYLASRATGCSVCRHGTETKGVDHEVCTPGSGPDLAGAVDALLTLGGQLVTPAAVGQLGPWHPALARLEFTVFDLETTGLHRVDDRITELAAIRLSVNGEVARMESLVNPGIPIPARVTEITGITDEDVAGAPRESEVLRQFADFCRGSVLAAHNIEFDAAFVSNGSERHGIEVDVISLQDTLEMARGKPGKPGLIPRDSVQNYKLGTLTRALGIRHDDAHRAMSDVEATAALLDYLLKMKYRQQSAA